MDETADDLCLTVLNEVCTNCAVAGIVEHGTERRAHSRQRSIPMPTDRDRTDMDSGNCGIFPCAGFLACE